jgi:hypothetical protein
MIIDTIKNRKAEIDGFLKIALTAIRYLDLPEVREGNNGGPKGEHN